MVMIPVKDEILVVISRCPRCEKYFSKQTEGVACAVRHAPGTCCHHKEVEITKEDVRDIKALINREFTGGGDS